MEELVSMSIDQHFMSLSLTIIEHIHLFCGVNKPMKTSENINHFFIVVLKDMLIK